ncbi:MAG: pentapeptide repeat-containing protein [Polaribacter sp.]|nr:pentapeptide repeat-containing protein [Polaribacter sp.]
MKKFITQKIVLLTLFVFCLSFVTTAQKRVDAEVILKAVKSGKTISYKNATIVGVLDFTFMDEALNNLPKRKKWRNYNNTNKVEKQIESSISFINCTFEDDVLAYIPDEHSGYTFTANFEEGAIFKNCTFKEKAMFKYSTFERDASFEDTTFNGDSTFKYAKFKKDSSFKNTSFEESSTFKYTKFNRNVSFANAVFKETATFKYAKFNDGVSFNNANFEEDLNLKYTKVSGDFDIKGMHVSYSINTKYTKINGKSFSFY